MKGVKIQAMVDVYHGKIGVLEGGRIAVLGVHRSGDEGAACGDVSAQVLEAAVTALPAGSEFRLPVRGFIADRCVNRKGKWSGCHAKALQGAGCLQWHAP